MKRGFVSIFFLVMVGMVITLIHQPVHVFPEERESAFFLTTKRTELENRVDATILHALQKGLVLQETPDIVKETISQDIANELQLFAQENPEITIETGMVTLGVNSYQSLIFSPIEQPVSVGALFDNSLVIIWPADEHSRYGEFIYTGGVFGITHQVPVLKMSVNENNTLFVIPIRYKVCAWNIIPDTTCIIAAEGTL